MPELCTHCQKVTATKIKQHPSGTEYLCLDCGRQVDFLHADELEPDDYDTCDCCGCELEWHEKAEGICAACDSGHLNN